MLENVILMYVLSLLRGSYYVTKLLAIKPPLRTARQAADMELAGRTYLLAYRELNILSIRLGMAWVIWQWLFFLFPPCHMCRS